MGHWKIYYVSQEENPLSFVADKPDTNLPKWTITFEVTSTATGAGSSTVTVQNPLQHYGAVYGLGVSQEVSFSVYASGASPGSQITITNTTENEVVETTTATQQIIEASLSLLEYLQDSIGDNIQGSASGATITTTVTSGITIGGSLNKPLSSK